MDHNSLMYDIRETLGVSLVGTSATISNESTRRFVGSLEMLDETQLSDVLKVSRKAAERPPEEPANTYHQAHDSPAMCRDHCFGQDIHRMRHHIRFNDLKEVYALAPVIKMMPEGMTVSSALQTITSVTAEQFDASTIERVAAHLHVSHELAKTRTGYHPDMMLLVHTLPDKARTIAVLAVRNSNTPTYREVIQHADIEPVLYDGLL